MARYRLTGVSAWGVQWEKKDDDRELARRLLNLLNDRRMLWRDYSQEIEEHCARSAAEARKQLGALLDSPEIGADLSGRVRAIQAAFRAFMDDVGPDDEAEWHRWRGAGTDRLSVALGRLRGVVGLLVGEVASTYRLDVSEDLATIVPDLGGWFFEPDRAGEGG